MRMILALTFVACTAVPAVWGQQTAPQPRVADVLAKLHSKYWSERTDALDEIASDQAFVHSRRIQGAVMGLLDQESEAFREDKGFNAVAASSAEDDGEEEYSEYLSSLEIVANMFADWNDPRQACTMVYAGDVAYPASAPEAAARARAAMPCLLKSAKSKFAIYRDAASPLLVEAVEKAQGTLDVGTAQAAKQIVLSNLQDPDVGVRSSTVLALGKFGWTDMIPALEEVAAKDPASEVDGRSIRKDAAEAIVAIRKRAQAANWR